MQNIIKNYLKLIRIEQWIKNLLIFAPLFFALKISNLSLLGKTFLAFLAFSLVASQVYIFNDIKDINDDQKHPLKKFRPIAHGTISVPKAKFIMFAHLSVGLVLGYFLNIKFLCILVFYVLLNFLYSLKLKHIAIVDIFIIAVGFVLRVFAGSIIAGVKTSMWIIIITFLLALFIALAKRRDDVILSQEGNKTRQNIDGYNLDFVNGSMLIISTSIIVCYILYATSQEIINKFHTDYLYLTTIFIILGVMRYLQLTLVDKASGSPVKIFLKDKFMQLSILGWIFTFGFLIYHF